MRVLDPPRLSPVEKVLVCIAGAVFGVVIFLFVMYGG